MPGGGEDIAKLLAKRARLRKVHCARQIQRQARVWLARLRRQYAFVDKVCRPGGIYEQGRLRAVVAAWRNFADDEDVRWSKGVAFFGYRAGYLWQDGNRDMKERRFVVFHDHIDIVDANTDKKVWSIEYSKVRRVSKGVEHKKHDVTVELRTGHRDVYKLLNPIGFVAAFQFNMMKWVHREERKHDRQRVKARHEEIFQEDRVSGEPEIEEFRPDPAPSLPGSAERSEASGEDVVDLVPPLRLACQSGLDKSGLFGPIQRPWKDDWIGLRPEARTQSQRYQDWKAMDPRIPFGSNRSHIFLVAIGDLEPFNGGCELRCLADFARAYFHGIRVTTLPPIPLRGLHRDRGMRLDMKLTGFETEEACKNTSVPIQLPEIERYLRKLLPTNAFVLIGITLHEVSGGEGYTRGSPYMTLPEMREHANRKRVCVLSLSRLDPWYRRNPSRDPHIQDSRETRKTLLLRRACKWLAHHAMLLFDMDHCVYHGCLMNGFAHLEEMGFVPLQICPICLRKLLDAIGIKTSVRCIERYRSLRRFCHVNQTVFSRDRAWYAVRIASLEKALLRHQTTLELERLFGASFSTSDVRSSLPRLDVRT